MSKEKQPYSSWSESINTFKEGKLPWGDNEFFMAAYRRNVEFLNTTQQIAVETMRAVTELQTEYMKSAFNQWSERAKECLSATSCEEKAACHTDIANKTIDQAIEHAREVNSILAKSNSKIIENFQKTAKKNVEETSSLSKKAKEK